MPSKSIKAIVNEINNSDADGGGLWLPNIQREFVWEEYQIERLFDSIMRQYPLSSMLIWKTRDEIKHRRFLENYNDGKVNLNLLYRSHNSGTKKLILDGQQRLQSLYIGLKGSIDGRTLHFDVLSGEAKSTEDIRFRFAFSEFDKTTWPKIPVSELVYTKKLPEEIMTKLLEKYSVVLSRNERHRVTVNISRLSKEFSSENVIVYQELDNTYDENDLTFNDVVEVFIRANSGGTKLSKSDLMFTLLTAEWTEADVEIEDFIEKINDNDRFQFNRDFLIKLSTTLLGYGAKYDVEKLRNEEVRKNISENWSKISNALLFVKDEVVSKTYIRSDKAMISYNALIPLIYSYFHFPDKWGQATFLPKYLIPALLSGAFSGQPDGLIDRLVNRLKKDREFNIESVFREFHEYGRNLKIGEEKILNRCGYKSGNIHLLFNLWYGNNYKPASIKNEPQVDHIFAKSILQAEKVTSTLSQRQSRKFSKWDIDQLANCMLLPAHQNSVSDKGNKPLDLWLSDKDENFLEIHCIPNENELWKVENYEKFIEERKKLILQRLNDIGIVDEISLDKLSI